jgi:hypothetical protein
MSTLKIATKKTTRTRKAKTVKLQPAAIQRSAEAANYCKNYTYIFAANLAKRNKKTKV